jgi:hypothetical protein
MTLEFSVQIFEKLKYKISRKSVQWERSRSMPTDRERDGQTGRQADMTKVIVAFRNFANSPKKG